MVLRTGYLCALLVTTTATVLAQTADPPSRVARLNYESGPFRSGQAARMIGPAATPNYPLTTGDHLWTDQGAQAEVHAGSTAIRMNAQTALSFFNLDDRTTQLSL